MQILLPVSFISIIGYLGLQDKKSRNIYFVFVSMLIAVVAFTYQPHMGDDLLREYQDLDNIRKFGWSYFVMNDKKFHGLYVTQLYYYFFSKLQINNLLPAVTTFLGYYFSFKALNKISDRCELSAINIWYVFSYIICVRETYMIFSNIRNQLAFVIFAYYLYIDLVEKRKRLLCFTIYLITIMIHQSAIILLAFRLICLIPYNLIKKMIIILMLFWSNELTAILAFLKEHTNIPFLGNLNLFYKLSIYTSIDPYNGGNASNIIVSSFYIKFMISNVFILILILISVYTCNNLNSEKEQILSDKSMPNRMEMSNYLMYALLLTCFTIGSCAYYWIYLRFSVMVQLVGIIVIAYTLKLYSYRKVSNKNYILILITASLIKMGIMMLVVNRSMHFSLFGIWS
ncbi:EpsG family protein [Clostridium kluyveri]|uniref:EpsG family protein n=1 Tax=Clostridium kluyveri TaxID=1534 RepID=UPI0022484A10|nr:EpsG family protein [Clostridium kluyveri]UZQ50360.1 EpsG family protein [Clostridium kluyveri]